MTRTKFQSVRGNVAYINIYGRIVLGETQMLRNALEAAIGSGYRHIIVDLAYVDKVDCTGLGDLVSYYVIAKSTGATIILCNVTKRIHDLLVISKLISIFPIIDGEVSFKAA